MTTLTTMANAETEWRSNTAEFANIMSQLQWTPVADTMPGTPRRADRFFAKGRTYTGAPYSNGGDEGRYIGFDIFLKTFLAAVENPDSVLYTRDLRGQRTNSSAYYGLVCSAFTSYGLQSAIMLNSRSHIPPHRQGIEPAEPQTAQGAAVGDVLFMPGHVELVTGITRDVDGTVTHVRVEDSTPPTTRTMNRTAGEFEAYLAQRKATLYHITDPDAWRGDGNPARLRFPDYADDSTPPTINRVLLLDRGDWVVYRKGEPVRINVMDRDNQGVSSLVIQRGDQVVETIPLDGPTIVERTLDDYGDYTAWCVMSDGSRSQACEFSVADIHSSSATASISSNDPLTIHFNPENMDVILVWVSGHGNLRRDSYSAPQYFWLSDDDRKNGSFTIPADVIARDTDSLTVTVEAENRYGRLRQRHELAF